MNAEFAKHLKEFRERSRLTQEEIASRLNMTQSHISKYETGRKIIDLETWVRWVKVTNCEAQAAIVMFGADILTQATNLVTLVPAFIPMYDVTQLFM